MSVRAVALHLHCYQPPRDNPWLGVVLREPSAAPFHDWNERITSECYRPQTAARLLDEHGLVAGSRNVFADCSFNVGPTLHGWFAEHARDVDQAIRAAEAAAAAQREGHGTAIAQPYVHAILPLAGGRDRATLIRWGVADFRARYGRRPEGMWLPETAVDVATLEALADAGVAYTIVAPQQVARVRPPGGEWHEVDAAALDPTRPYRVQLPSGRPMTVCVFDGPLSRAVAFDRALLSDGDALGRALLAGFGDREGPQLLLMATDGETFGHHHRFGEMALARALATVEADPATQLMTPGEFLSRYPAEHEAELVEPSAWSCPHGVGRWMRDCGCSTSGRPGWNQTWRAPLRAAVDWLRDAVGPRWEEVAGRLLADPWAARDAYADVLVAPGDASRSQFLEQHGRVEASQSEADVWGLMELQRHLLVTSTSCGWFFADPASLETAVVLRHAACVVDLARELLGLELEEGLVEMLVDLRSNEAAEGAGAQLWHTWARGAEQGALDVAAAWAALTLADPVSTRGHFLGRVCRALPEPPGDRPSPASGGAESPEDTTTGHLEVTDPATGRSTTVRYLASWRRDGGPHVWVRDATAGRAPGGEADDRRYDVTDLPDDVVVELLRVCLTTERAVLATEPGPRTQGRALDAVLERAAGCGLDVLGPAIVDANRVLVAASEAALHDPARLPALDAWVALTRTVPADHGRFAAENVVLALREQLPAWEQGTMLLPAAAALRRLAGRLRVAVPDPV